MNKNRLMMCAALCSLFLLSGCLTAKTHSMGASLMTVAHQPRAYSDSTNAETSMTVNAFGSMGNGFNVENVKSGGGDVSFMYRMGGAVSPVFVTAAVGGFGGVLNFACTKDSRCDNGSLKFSDWLKTDEGKDDYSFWDVQERILVGGDFYPGKYAIMGLGAGVQFYQGGGDYEDKRDGLEKVGYTESIEGKNGAAPVGSLWLGSRLGENGKWGSVVAEYDIRFYGNVDEWLSSAMLTYFHTSGFFGGFVWNSHLGYELNVGKTFVL